MLTAVVRSPALRLLRHRAPRGWSGRTAAAPRAASSGRSIEGETAAGASDSGYAAAREAQAARLHRFYVDDPLPSSGGTFHLGREESRHATKALRLKPGDRLEVCDGAGGLVVAELVGMEGSGRDGGVAAVAAVGEVRRVPFAGPKWHGAVAFMLVLQRTPTVMQSLGSVRVHSARTRGLASRPRRDGATVEAA